ncbi:hypothetical protein [Halobacterium sp. CBA1126]|uniref:hypothetical protein n=1 Tax=Halobacterium sp. CBA1126 TaxID=2668074 RepID=UPI0012FBA389|nr:hypothetical protein [Halobacterium sp. CBA1126]MUV59975.1 hypothetical protein [Halobacterium sp. CBA1126]
MTDFDYPPTRTFTLEEAKGDVESELADAEARVDELEDDEDAQESALRDARSEREDAAGKQRALNWAIGEFGEDATITMEAFTATTRARALDEMQSSTMGDVGGMESRIWLLAAALQAAPWLNGSEDLEEAARVTGALPPAVQDFLDDELTDLNDLSSENLS